MLKQLISYLIIFSILFPDIAHCGSVWGMESPEIEDEGEHSPLAVRRQSTQDDPSAKRGSTQVSPKNGGEPDEKTPLVFSGQTDPTFIPGIPINFQVVAQGGSLQGGESLPLLPHDSGSITTNDREDESSSSEEIIIGAARPDTTKQGSHPTLTKALKADESETENPGNLPVGKGKKRPRPFKPGDPKGKEPRTTLESDEVGSQEGARSTSTFRSESEENAYNQQSWKQLTPLQKKGLTGGELTAFSGPPPSTPGKRMSLNLQTPSTLDEEDEDTKDFFLVPLDKLSTLSPETEDFLTYVKVRVVDGKLNWKQIMGIGGGVVIGAGVAWPWMCIMFDSLLKIYNKSIHPSQASYLAPKVLTEKFRNFNRYINFYTMMLLVGIPTGIAVASRTASVLTDFVKDSPQSFSLQKNKKHEWALRGAKSALCFGAFFSALLPVYYLHSSILGCDTRDSMFNKTENYAYDYRVLTDILLDISINVTVSDKNIFYCTLTSKPLKNFILFDIGVPFLVLSAFLPSIHQLSTSATGWINDYFFAEMRKSSHLSSTEITHQEYAAFKNLKRMIDALGEVELDNLYNNVFMNNGGKTDQHFEINDTKLTTHEAVRILNLFNTFHHQHKPPLKNEDSETWKKTCASRIGWAIPHIATFGRMIIFQTAIEQLLGTFWGADCHGYNCTSSGATLLSNILGYSFAHLSQGWVEKEAVKESVYEILGGKKLTDGRSHNSLRTGIKAWDYLYGALHTLPYLVEGVAGFRYFTAQYPFNVSINVQKILFLLSFGIADAFNNAVAFHHSNLNLVNAFDSIQSYWTPSVGYKRNKLVRITHQLRKLFKELRPEVMQEMDSLLQKEFEQLRTISHLGGDRGDELFPTSIPLFTDISRSLHPLSRAHDDEFGDLPNNKSGMKGGVNHDESIAFPPFSPKTQEFLYYVKKRIIDGELNGKQKIGMVGGLITGVAVAWPMMMIIFDGLLSSYVRIIFSQYKIVLTAPHNLTEEFEKFHSFINFKTMMAMIGIPMAIDAASRTSFILMDFLRDTTQFFALQKTKTHKWALLGTKGSIYVGVLFAGLLPIYYLYESLLGCNKNNEGWFYDSPPPHTYSYTYTVSTDILMNFNNIINSPDFGNCILQEHHRSPANKILFGISAPFLLFDIVLQYGHQLSHHAEHWINDYFFTQLRKSSQFSLTETIRQKYLTQFKNLKRTIYESDEKVIGNLYDDIFGKIGGKTEYTSDLGGTASTINEAIRILKIFNGFHGQHKSHLEEEVSADWKKTCSSCIGWTVPLIATFGRMLIFQYLIEELFKNVFEFEGAGSAILSVILGGIFANLAQGWIEKDGVQQGVYEILRGEKTTDGRSHNQLRRGIKTWDYLYGTFHTLPYLVVGRDASLALTYFTGGNDNPTSGLLPFQYLLLITFGLADAFNNAIAFHDSNLKVVDTYDSVRSYWSPTPEYKRDKLVRVMHQLRKLFKELDHDVLLEVDQILNRSPQSTQLVVDL